MTLETPPSSKAEEIENTASSLLPPPQASTPAPNTYTISYPSEWQSKINRMINCYVLLDKLRNGEHRKEADTTKRNDSVQSSNEVKLRCGVCRAEFDLLDDLAEHKEQNLSCKNNICLAQTDETPFNMKKAKRRKKELKLVPSLSLAYTNRKKSKKSSTLSSNSAKTTKHSLFDTSYYQDEDLEDNEQDRLTDFVNNHESMYIDECATDTSESRIASNKSYIFVRQQQIKAKGKVNSLDDTQGDNGYSSNIAEFLTNDISITNDSNCNSDSCFENDLLKYKHIEHEQRKQLKELDDDVENGESDVNHQGDDVDDDIGADDGGDEIEEDQSIDEEEEEEEEAGEKEAYSKPPRRMYTKQRVGPVTNLTCESKLCLKHQDKTPRCTLKSSPF